MKAGRMELIKRLVQTLEDGRGAGLCAVVQATGSTPRKSGAKMAVFEDGSTAGTVGGGVVERQCVDLAKAALKEGRSFGRQFNMSSPEAAENGMVCGGEVEIRFERLAPSDRRTLRVLEAALESQRAEQRGWLVFDLSSDSPNLNFWDGRRGGPVFPDSWLEGSLAVRLESKAERLDRPFIFEEGGSRLFLDPVETPSTVYVFGGGHVARELVPILARVGFSVTVLDDRSQFASPAFFPDAERTLLVDFEKIAGPAPLKAEDYVVVMTRGHLSDLTVLKQVLKVRTSYLGVIGSRKKLDTCHKKLLDAGFSEEDIRRIHGPIGLEIGAETPAEIAVSIAAEMIAARAGLAAEGARTWTKR